MKHPVIFVFKWNKSLKERSIVQACVIDVSEYDVVDKKACDSDDDFEIVYWAVQLPWQPHMIPRQRHVFTLYVS